MTVRVFRARIGEGRVADFVKMVQTRSIPWLERSDGMLGYSAGDRMPHSPDEFVMITIWRDVAAPKASAGEHRETPAVTEDETLLVDEMFAHHCAGFDRTRRAR